MARRRFVPITSGLSNDVEVFPIRDALHGANGTNRTIQEEAAPKRARRHTRMNDFWKLKRGEKAPIPLNDFGPPIGNLGGSYYNFLGKIARHSTYCPLVYEQWPDVPIHMKNKIWDDEVLENENVGDAKLWLEGRGVCLDKYRSLKASVRGKTKRSNEKVPHAAGSKAFRWIAHDMLIMDLFKLLCRIVFRILLEEEEEEEDKLEQDNQDGDEESDTQAGTDPARPWINDGYSKVMGADKGSIVSLMGQLTLSVRKGNPRSKESDSNSNPLAENFSAYEVKMNDMQKEINELKAERAHQSSATTQ
ncbi:hypothetical protein ACFE04_009251 [Oxalis oulophora]